MRKLLRILAVGILGVGLSGGLASAATNTIGSTGPDSTNTVATRTSDTHKVTNNNRVRASSLNPQLAITGDATTAHNNTGGSATTGTAANDSLLRANVSLTNSTEGAAAVATAPTPASSDTTRITNTGPGSDNSVMTHARTETRITNNNAVSIKNVNLQGAITGSARVTDNTTGGSARSGNASNISTTDLIVNVKN